ncbi:MAG: O-antigen ligase family protein [Flavisolibacter sp.]
MTGRDVLPLFLVFLYLFVDFIPRFEGADVMGAQWIYLAVVNVLSAIYVFFNRKSIAEALSSVGRNVVTIVFTAFYVLAAVSILFAMNKIESYVVFGRFSTMFVGFLSMSVLLYNRPNFFKIIAQILAIFLLLQSVDLLNQFFTNFESLPMTELVNSLKMNSGNKNIMAASLVMKVPFAIYCIYNQRLFGKIFNLGILLLGTLTIFFVNARASYISLILVGLLFIGYSAFEYLQEKNLKVLLRRAMYFFIPFIVTFLLSNVIIDSKLSLEEEATGYGSVAERLGTLSISQQANSLRMNQYKGALAYIQSHPLMGAGFGNWKLASIPYERTFSDEMYISYHVHNDFLEYTAEMGIVGGLLYLAIYLALAVLSFRVIFSKTATRAQKQMSAFALMALAVYFIDAMFNFPMERPIMQVFLGFIVALHINIYLQSRSQVKDQRIFKWTPPVFTVFTIAVMLPSIWIGSQVYKSMVAQGKYNQDMLSGTPVYKSAQVVPSLPDIPNLNVFGFPIDAIKARYYLAEKKYDSSLLYLNRSMDVNPYITYNEFLKGNLYLERQEWDSAFKYAQKAFYMKPRAKSNYQLYNAVLAHYRDSTAATNAFNETRQFRNEAWLWNDYINIMYNCGKDYQFLANLADSAAKLFPDDPDLKRKQVELGALRNTPR